MRTPRLKAWHWALTAALWSAPAIASANFFWPPALYFYSLGVWWVVPVGLLTEAALLSWTVQRPLQDLFLPTALANAASAFVGFVVTYPLVFWEPGVEWAVLAVSESRVFWLPVVGTLSIVLAINVGVEHRILRQALALSGAPRLLFAVLAANVASFVVLGFGAGSLLARWTAG